MKHRHQAEQEHYRVVGYDPLAHVCEDCGKRNLDGAVVLAGSAGGKKRVGSDCAARLAGGRPEVLLHRAKKLSLKTPSYLSSPEQSDYHAPYVEVLERADEMRADPAFKEWLGESELVDENGQPEIMYRGVQHPRHIHPNAPRKKTKGPKIPASLRSPRARTVASYTPLASVAAIYSMRPGDAWGEREPSLAQTSTVQPAFIRVRKPIRVHELSTTFGDILRALRYGEPNGITDDEVLKMLNYLHNREVGEASGGDLLYKVFDENEEEVEADWGDLLHGRTKIQNLRDDIEMDPDSTLDLADRLHAETYAFFDAPAAKRAAERLGYDAFVHTDPFRPGRASEILFDKEGEDLTGVGDEWNLEGEEVPIIDTIRPFSEDQIRPIIPGGVSTATFLHGFPETPTKRKPPRSIANKRKRGR